MGKLWEAIFQAPRASPATIRSPTGGATARPEERVDLLNAKRYHSLRFIPPDGATDLNVGLADQHLWAGGGPPPATACTASRTFPLKSASPRRTKTASTAWLRASKPLSHQGTLIENIRCRFEDGKIVK